MTGAASAWRPRGLPGTIAIGLALGLLAFAVFGPLVNLALWAFAERWYVPNRIPSEFGFTFWSRVFSPRGGAVASLGTSVWIAVLTVIVSLAVAVPAGYALARIKLRWRGLWLICPNGRRETIQHKPGWSLLPLERSSRHRTHSHFCPYHRLGRGGGKSLRNRHEPPHPSRPYTRHGHH